MEPLIVVAMLLVGGLLVMYLTAAGSVWKLALAGSVLGLVRFGLGAVTAWATYMVAQKLWPIFPHYNLLDLAVIMVAMFALERLVLAPLAALHAAAVHRRLANEATAAVVKGLAAQKLGHRTSTLDRRTTQQSDR